MPTGNGKSCANNYLLCYFPADNRYFTSHSAHEGSVDKLKGPGHKSRFY